MTIEVEHPLPEGYEAVTFRVPKVGETFLGEDSVEGPVAVVARNDSYQIPRLILRKAWVWPTWLKCYCITRDIQGVYGWEGEPKLYDDIWVTLTLVKDPIKFAKIPEFIDLGLPQLPANQSIWRNPCFQSAKP